MNSYIADNIEKSKSQPNTNTFPLIKYQSDTILLAQ